MKNLFKILKNYIFELIQRYIKCKKTFYRFMKGGRVWNFPKKIKFIALFFVLIFSFSNTFANSWDLQTNSWAINDLKLEISSTKIWIWEDFTLKTSLDLWNQTDITEVQIFWADKFNHIWNSNSMRLQSVNWLTKWIYDVEMRFQATEKWNFTVWPIEVKIWDKIHSSNTVSLEVWDIPTVWVNTQNTNSQVQNDTSSLTDINDNVWQKDFNFNFYFWIFILIWFFVLFYFLLKYYFSLNESKKEFVVKENFVEISKKEYFLEKLNQIKNDKEKLDKWSFLNKTNDLIREILEYLWVQNATKKTFKELEKNPKTDKKLLEILKETYFEQFKDKELELDKDEILENLKKILDKIS